MMSLKLQVQNIGLATVVLKDFQGYSDFVMEVATTETKTKNITQDVLQRLESQLKALETPTYKSDGTTILSGIRWAVLADSALDDRSMPEGLAGLPSLNELRAASYSTGGGGTDVVATGTGLLGNQTKATRQIFVGTARLDLESVAPGAPGNSISCEIITPSGTLLVSVAGNKITVRPAAAGSTVAAIVAAINAHASAKLLVQTTEGVAGTFNAAVTEAYLAGGKGPGVSLTLNGTACVLTEVTNVQLTFDIPTGISAASRIVPLEYREGPHISRLSVPVVA
jgi:hypothetical protein